jgi:hypothetical protein
MRLKLGGFKVTTVQVTKLPLWHKINKKRMIGFAKPGRTAVLHIRMLKGKIFNIMPYVLHIQLRKAKHIHKRVTEDAAQGL